MVYGCSAHALNLVESAATPRAVLSPIVVVAKFFRDHHKPAALLKEAGGRIPQLPNSTKWTSQRKCLSTFVKNYELYGTIIDSGDISIPDNIKNFVNNLDLVGEAKHMLAQLNHVAAVLNTFQDDQ